MSYPPGLLLERVVLNQNRFRIPGVAPDPRGAVLGQRGALLFPSIDRVVGFFRVYSDENSIDDLLSSLSIRKVRTSLGTHEFVVWFNSTSSYVMDKAAAITKLLGGFAFTGTSRHFVKYRDAASPLGYDVAELEPEGGDIALYHDTFRQVYWTEREIEFGDLLFRLSPHRVPKSTVRMPETVLVLARPGLGPFTQGYLVRSRVTAEVALVERPAASAFDEGPERLFLFRAHEVPERIIDLLCATPGLEVFDPLGDNFGVELCFRHPINLESCASVFASDRLYLFAGRRDRVEILENLPPFTDLRRITRLQVDLGRADPARLKALPPRSDPVGLKVRLVTTTAPWKHVTATVVPIAQAEWLRKMIYVLPPRVLSSFRVFVGEERIVLVSQEGVESVPLGTYYYPFGSQIFLPAGYTLLPAASPQVLLDALGGSPGTLFFFEPGGQAPLALREPDFAPLARRSLLDVASVPSPAAARSTGDTSGPRHLVHDSLGLFPLWGVPGKKLPKKTE
ncbi:MAG: hypothetical protein HYY06_31120 [Deltaproteobacteria bacterium]|nr:hypothetical protein [Deltaproteobacteria bacterium]